MAVHGTAPLRRHLNSIERDGAGEAGREAELYTDARRDLDAEDSIARAEDGRHHFRFIVSPEDAEQMSDVKAFTRDLMGQMEKDLETRLEWVAVNHYNTGQPHVHIAMRGSARMAKTS